MGGPAGDGRQSQQVDVHHGLPQSARGTHEVVLTLSLLSAPVSGLEGVVVR